MFADRVFVDRVCLFCLLSTFFGTFSSLPVSLMQFTAFPWTSVRNMILGLMHLTQLTFNLTFASGHRNYICSTYNLRPMPMAKPDAKGNSISTAQHSTAQHSTAQRSAAQRSAAQRSAAQRSSAQLSATQRNATQRNAAQRSEVQCSAAQPIAAQHNTSQHSTMQYTTRPHSNCGNMCSEHAAHSLKLLLSYRFY